MKFHWFDLMPWPYLPDDFTERHRSVWVDVDSRLFNPVKANRVYNDYLDLLELAEDLGYDGLGINEHHQNAYGLMPSPQLMAATLARRTREAAILLLGQSLALYDPPTRVAEEMAMIDCISGGRLIAGFPVGSSMDDNYACGVNPATLREKYHEAHDLIRRAWSDPDVFAWNGKYFKMRHVNLWPRPIQQPPPIWIPGGGSVETWDFCATHQYNYSYLVADPGDGRRPPPAAHPGADPRRDQRGGRRRSRGARTGVARAHSRGRARHDPTSGSPRRARAARSLRRAGEGVRAPRPGCRRGVTARPSSRLAAFLLCAHRARRARERIDGRGRRALRRRPWLEWSSGSLPRWTIRSSPPSSIG
jgi:alkanesulfonate monooxygenase SsuD/methylene tetrahydromethanopterin reductase-like flavin-dependent oxidoreductase (luciferase family)